MQLLERLVNLILVQFVLMYSILSVWFIFMLLSAVKAQPVTAAAVCKLCLAHVLCAAAITAPE